MDYCRIHLLLDKYWRCVSSVDEERELRRFFTSETVPPELLPYQAWFRTPEAEELPPLEETFDVKIMESISSIQKERRRRLFVGLAFVIIAILAGVALFFILPE